MARKGDKKEKRPLGDRTDPNGMAVLCQKHLDWMNMRNFSDLTVNYRLLALNKFIAWGMDRGIVRPCEVTKPILECYQRWLYLYRKQNGDPLSFATQKSLLIPIRAWFKWLARNNHILYNPASDLDLPKIPKKLPKGVLTAQEAEIVMSQPDVTDPMGIRDRAILETLYSTGMRRVELANLSIYDIDRDRQTILIRRGKGQKERIVPVGERALAWLTRYEQEVRPRLMVSGQPTNVLFLTHFGEEFELDSLSSMVRDYIATSDLGKQGSCHTFRHTCATLMLENGAEIRFIQVLLGHASVTTTEIYAQVSIKKLQEIHRATHPAKAERKAKGDAAAG
jgi:integrase/recombinase XerD